MNNEEIIEWARNKAVKEIWKKYNINLDNMIDNCFLHSEETTRLCDNLIVKKARRDEFLKCQKLIKFWKNEAVRFEK